MKVLISGDYVPNHRVTRLINDRCFEEVFGEIRPYFQDSDFSIVNLEAPVIHGAPTPIAKTGPNLSCSEQTIEALKWLGAKCVTLANNHFYDQGEQGVTDTINACKKYDLLYVGGGANLEQASHTLLFESKECKLAIVNCCENEWAIATAEHGGSNPLNVIQQYHAIRDAKKIADYVLVIVHGGIEMYQFPTPQMKERYRFFVDAGADSVVSHHQHCHSGYEIYQGKPIFYGIGNFCFDNPSYRNSKWNEGFLVNLVFDKTKMDFEIIPYNQCNETAKVSLLTDIEKETFTAKVKGTNRVIADDKALSESFDNFCSMTSGLVFSQFEPYRSKLFTKLYKRRLLPSFLKGKKGLNILNFIRCESHRERVENTFRNAIKKHTI